jgi:hypothetical protein
MYLTAVKLRLCSLQCISVLYRTTDVPHNGQAATTQLKMHKRVKQNNRCTSRRPNNGRSVLCYKLNILVSVHYIIKTLLCVNKATQPNVTDYYDLQKTINIYPNWVMTQASVLRYRIFAYNFSWLIFSVLYEVCAHTRDFEIPSVR